MSTEGFELRDDVPEDEVATEPEDPEDVESYIGEPIEEAE